MADEGRDRAVLCYNIGKAGETSDRGEVCGNYCWRQGSHPPIVSALFAAFMRRLERREKLRREEAKKHEEERHKLELLQVRGTLAAMSLGEATATALKNGHANGETDKALAYEQRVKHEMREFLEKSGVEHVA